MPRPSRDENVIIRVAETERELWKRAAARADLTLSDWIRHTLNAAARGGK